MVRSLKIDLLPQQQQNALQMQTLLGVAIAPNTTAANAESAQANATAATASAAATNTNTSIANAGSGVMNRPSDRCGSGGVRVTVHATGTPKGLVSLYRIIRLILIRSSSYCSKRTGTASGQHLPGFGIDPLGESSARPGGALRPRAGRPNGPLTGIDWGCFPGSGETAPPLCQTGDTRITGQLLDPSRIIIAPLRAWFLGHPWSTECTLGDLRAMTQVRARACSRVRHKSARSRAETLTCFGYSSVKTTLINVPSQAIAKTCRQVFFFRSFFRNGFACRLHRIEPSRSRIPFG